MSNKVELIYENGEYTVKIQDKNVVVLKDIDLSIEKFKQVIKDNVVSVSYSWDSTMNKALSHNIEDLEINEEYKAITYKNLKFFFSSGKVFYNNNNSMIPLLGGFYTFDFLVAMEKDGHINDYEEVASFCGYVLEKKSTYRVTESSIVIGSAAFNYGNCEYNFLTGKISKGASVTTGAFEEFETYVKSILK